MTIPKVHNENIKLFFDKTELIKETITQIVKDFGLFGIEINFPENIETAYEVLLEELSNLISTMIHNDHARLMSVLYQVDITDKHIHKAEAELPNYTLIEVIAHQVIMRDLQKVLTRHYFKSLE